MICELIKVWEVIPRVSVTFLPWVLSKEEEDEGVESCRTDLGSSPSTDNLGVKTKHYISNGF